MHSTSLPLLLLLTLPLACKAPEPAPAPPGLAPGDTAGAWTQAFRQPANLVADEIYIEGPPALRDHIVVRQDPRSTRYSTEATERGLLQETSARAEAGYVEIHGTLDAWKLVAFRRIRWLERPGNAAVLVRAQGSAVWQSADGSMIRREPILEFRGRLAP